jgi:hypothetical protein
MDIFFLILYVVVGILSRTIFHIAPNVEFVTGLSIAAGYFFHNKKLSFIVPLSIMAITDFIIGNNIIFLFTWSAFLIAPLFKYIVLGVQKNFKGYSEYFKLFISSEVAGILFTLFFFLWTNFGVVITTDMYPKNIIGVAESYIMGLPFLANQLLGNIIIVPFIFVSTAFIMFLYSNRKYILKCVKSNLVMTFLRLFDKFMNIVIKHI